MWQKDVDKTQDFTKAEICFVSHLKNQHRLNTGFQYVSISAHKSRPIVLVSYQLFPTMNLQVLVAVWGKKTHQKQNHKTKNQIPLLFALFVQWNL